MEALNKQSEFAAPVLTWAQKRSDLREKLTVGKFVRSSLQGLNHEDVLLKLETKIINNGKGHARASAHGLRAIMETMLHGSQFYMLFKEAFHIYGSFFETKKDEEAFRDILLHLETGLNVVIVTHPVTVYTLVLGSITSRCSGKSARTHPPKELSFREGSKTGPGRRRKSSLHLCEFREKVRQYCINKFVRTTWLSKHIILFDNNTYILVKKIGRRTLRESNDSVNLYIYH